MKTFQKVCALVLTAATILLCTGCFGKEEKGKIQDFPRHDVLSSSFGLTENEILTKMGWEESEMVKLNSVGDFVTVPLEIELAGKQFQATYHFGYDANTLADVYFHSTCSADPETAAEEMVAVLRAIVPMTGVEITEDAALGISAKDMADALTASKREYLDHVYKFDLSDMAEESLQQYARQLEQTKAFAYYQDRYELFYRLQLTLARDEQADPGEQYRMEIKLGFDKREIEQ